MKTTKGEKKERIFFRMDFTEGEESFLSSFIKRSLISQVVEMKANWWLIFVLNVV